jgi:uncharacterized short protein YbdD (DUF466 family)
MSTVLENLARLGIALQRVIGAPDYERYVAHARACHPGSQPLSWDAFYRSRLDDRYNKPGARCC